VVSGRIPVSDNRIPMSDGAGFAEAIGDGVTDFAPGDLVVSCFFPRWQAENPKSFMSAKSLPAPIFTTRPA
jgi:NADPH:quinone reductase-like Zn-dependent oxidoreductase